MSIALTGGSALLALCLVVAVVLIVPWDFRRRATSPGRTLDVTADPMTEPDRPAPATKEFA